MNTALLEDLNSGTSLSNSQVDYVVSPIFQADNDNIDPQKRSAGKFSVSWHGENKVVPVPWLVPDIIPEQSSGLFVGESGVGKTFVATHLAVAMATGNDFLGKKTKGGGTLYVPAEAPDTVYERLDAACRALMMTNGEGEPSINLDELPIAILNQVPNLAVKSEVDALIECVLDVAKEMESRHAAPLRLIVIDTMLAAFALADWNGASDATKAMMALARISRETGATVIGLHHHGKDVSRGAAGSFALTAHADFALSIFQKATANGEVAERWAAVTKLRRGRTGWACKFDLKCVDIGTDADGQPAQSAYVVPSGEIKAGQRTNEKAAKDSGKALKALISAMRILTAQGIGERRPESDYELATSDKELREAFGGNYESDSSNPNGHKEAVRKAYGRAVKQATFEGSISTGHWDNKDWFWIPSDEDLPF